MRGGIIINQVKEKFPNIWTLACKIIVLSFWRQSHFSGCFESHFPWCNRPSATLTSGFHPITNVLYQTKAFAIKESGQLAAENPSVLWAMTATEPAQLGVNLLCSINPSLVGIHMELSYHPPTVLWGPASGPGILAFRLSSSYAAPAPLSVHSYPFHSHIVKQFSKHTVFERALHQSSGKAMEKVSLTRKEINNWQ